MCLRKKRSRSGFCADRGKNRPRSARAASMPPTRRARNRDPATSRFHAPGRARRQTARPARVRPVLPCPRPRLRTGNCLQASRPNRRRSRCPASFRELRPPDRCDPRHPAKLPCQTTASPSPIHPSSTRQGAKVFCFFFAKKKRLLSARLPLHTRHPCHSKAMLRLCPCSRAHQP